jgi:outer membrane immunogenic protein
MARVLKMMRAPWHLAIVAAPLGLALAQPALGADLAPRPPLYKALPSVAGPYSWTGFYGGVNLGYGAGQNAGSLSYGPAPSGTEIFNSVPNGVFGGGQFGYNYQIGGIVIGAETDIQGSGISDTRTCLLGCATASGLVSQKLDWFGTTRARVGLATGPVLTYVTGGLAYGETETGISIVAPAGTSAFSTASTRSGWTWGTGVEASLGGNWTGKLEYLYVDLGSASVASGLPSGTGGTFSTKYQEQLYRAGVNYKFGPEQGPIAIGPLYNWNGFFVGGTFGYGLGQDSAILNGPAVAEAVYLSPRGFLGGGIAGYNWQFGHWVAGIDTDIQGNFGDGYLTCVSSCGGVGGGGTLGATVIDEKTPWIGTTRLRGGYAVGPALFYVTGGAAYGGVKDQITRTSGGSTSSFSFDQTKGGWTIGAGLENKLDIFGLLGPNWTTRTEYLYVDLGSVNDTIPGGGGAGTQILSSNVHEHIWRTTVTYKFGPTTF